MPAYKQKNQWQEALSTLITDPDELLTLLELDKSMLLPAQAAALLFPLKVPRSYLQRIEKGNPEDPLLKQILPHGHEQLTMPGFDEDPLNEALFNPVPGLLHKYQSRVLVTLTSACAVHCRYCFRRHFPYDDNNPGKAGWQSMFDYIQSDHRINEVILSGGDPLSVPDHHLKAFTDGLQFISHLKRLRIHTRLPIVMPLRVTTGLIEWIQSIDLDIVLVVHANHPREVNQEVMSALGMLRHHVTLLNQSVLLKDVNDDVDTLVELSEVLFSAGALPYYLHLLDKVKGAAHFDLPLAKALALHAEMAKRLPGYLLPRLVREEPGEASKSAISSTGLCTE